MQIYPNTHILYAVSPNYTFLQSDLLGYISKGGERFPVISSTSPAIDEKHQPIISEHYKVLVFTKDGYLKQWVESML